MNIKFKYILIACAITLAIMLLFPPFFCTIQSATSNTAWSEQMVVTENSFNLGYNFILSPPSYSKRAGFVNCEQLLTQCGVVILICGLLYFALQNKDGKRS